jgi:hypothetical protein
MTKRKTITVIDKTFGLQAKIVAGAWDATVLNACAEWTGCIPENMPDEHCGGWTLAEQNRVFIWLEKKPTNIVLTSYLVHELTHAVSLHCRLLGIQDDETFAYLMTFLFTQSMTKLKSK